MESPRAVLDSHFRQQREREDEERGISGFHVVVGNNRVWMEDDTGPVGSVTRLSDGRYEFVVQLCDSRLVLTVDEDDNVQQNVIPNVHTIKND